jgi:predicted nucleic acid-binding protein
MRLSVVVDASVVVKWILPEPGHERALRLLDLYQDEKLDLIAPHLLLAEVGNVLWKRQRRGEISRTVAQRCFQQLVVDSPILLESPQVSASALELAMAHDRTVYDCTYLAWALEQRCDLVTADEKLFRAVSPAFSCVQSLQRFEVRIG